MLHGVLHRLLRDVVKSRGDLRIDLQRRVGVDRNAPGEARPDARREPVQGRPQARPAPPWKGSARSCTPCTSSIMPSSIF